MKFEEMNLKKELLKGIDELGYSEATDVQEKCVPLVLKNKDIIVQSKTGSGKTGGFAIPLLQMINGDGINGLVLVPTRELAVQVDKEINSLGKYLNIHSISVYGGANIDHQVRNLKQKHIIVATPGRLIDIFKRGHIKFDKIKHLVLDEADRMLDMGFEKDIDFILSKINDSQTLLFSATIPRQIKQIAQKYMRDPESLMLSKDTYDVSSIQHTYYGAKPNNKITTLAYIIDVEKPRKCMVFCNRKRTVDMIQKILSKNGYKIDSLHGDMRQNRRDAVVRSFKQGDHHILVASDVAARGIHVDDVTHVINFDLPEEPDIYIHRVGRTGRAGNKGKAISILVQGDNKVFENITRRGISIEPEYADPTKMPTIKVAVSPKHGSAQRRREGRGGRGKPRSSNFKGKKPYRKRR